MCKQDNRSYNSLLGNGAGDPVMGVVETEPVGGLRGDRHVHTVTGVTAVGSRELHDHQQAGLDP